MRQIQSVDDKRVGLIAKASAIAAVVVVHLMSLWPDSIYTTSEYKWLFLGLNQLTRFSVPVFLALSGYGLAKKYQQSKPSVSRLMFERIKKLAPLYLIWSFILLLVFRLNNDWATNVPLWRGLATGSVDYHLYFVPLILQLYLLFAFLPKIITRNRLLIVLICSAALQLVLFGVIRWASVQESSRLTNYLLSDQSQYRVLFNWLYYFSLGVFVSQFNLNKLRGYLRLKLIILCLILVGLWWSVVDANSIIQATGNIVYATSFVRLPIFIFTTGAILGFIVYGHKLLNLPIFNSRLVEYVGKKSYLIYLSHTLLIRIIDELMNGGFDISVWTMTGALVVGAVISSKIASA